MAREQQDFNVTEDPLTLVTGMYAVPAITLTREGDTSNPGGKLNPCPKGSARVALVEPATTEQVAATNLVVPEGITTDRRHRTFAIRLLAELKSR